MHIIALAAQKGGVGKTTASVYIGAALARRGIGTLVVDLDPQANATALLAPQAAIARGTGEVLLERVAIVDVAQETACGVALVASASPESMDRAELALAGELGREKILSEALRAAKGWDVCLIDCPPSLGLLTANALTAAHSVLTPVTPAYFSLTAIKKLERNVEVVQKRLNRKLRQIGFLLSAIDSREGVADTAREQLREHVGELLWSVEVRVDTTFKHGPCGPSGRGREDYDAVSEELLRRIRR